MFGAGSHRFRGVPGWKRSGILCVAVVFGASAMFGAGGVPVAGAEASGPLPSCYSRPAVAVPGIEAVEQVKRDYFHDIDAKNWSGLGTRLAPDVVVDTVGSAGPVFPDRDSFVAFLKLTLGRADTHHQGFDPHLRMTSATTAAGEWTLQDVLVWGNTFGVHGYGHYWDCYVKIDGRWVERYSKLTRTRIDLIEPDGTVIQADAPLDVVVRKFHELTGL